MQFQVVIEIPYVFIQAVLFTITVYPTIGYYWSAYKVLWFFYTMFCTLLSSVYLGMLLISLTPNVQVAFILSSFFNQNSNIFSGFMIPASVSLIFKIFFFYHLKVCHTLGIILYVWLVFFAQHIPKWWIWLYYIMPISWALNGFFTSQYGDIHTEIIVFGETKSVPIFLKEYFGFHHDRLGVVAIVLLAFPLLFSSLFAYCITKLNFQRR